MKLSPEALQRIKDHIEAGYGIGDSQLASDLQVLLDFYLQLTEQITNG